MSKIEIGRYSELLRRAFGMKGQESVSGELSPEVSPVWVLEDDSPEWDFLKQVRGCAGAGIEIPAAGNAAVFRLRNPVGSGTIATVRTIEMSSGGAAEFRITRNLLGVELANVGVTVVPDFRWGQSGATTTTSLIFSSKSNSAVLPAGDLMQIATRNSNRPVIYTPQIVLVPGTAIDFGLSTLATQCTAFCTWKERRLPALEG